MLEELDIKRNIKRKGIPLSHGRVAEGRIRTSEGAQKRRILRCHGGGDGYV